MNLVLIQLLAKSGVAIIISVIAHICWSQIQAEFRQKEWAKYKKDRTCESIGITGESKMMDSGTTKHSTEGRKGLQQRRSFSDMMGQNDGIQNGSLVKEVAAQSVDMQRSISGQSSVESLESWKSTSSATTEGSVLTAATTVNTSPGQPSNFGIVVPGVYRSSYPREEDYEFIQKLNLKTIVTLVDKDIPQTFIPFMQANSIQHHKIALQGTKKETVPVSTMAAILQVVHDERNHPMLIHCNQGRVSPISDWYPLNLFENHQLIFPKHRTGCVVALVRKLQNWDLSRILEEYKTYAAPKIRDCDVDYVTKFQVADIQHLALAPLPESAPLPVQHPVKSRRTRFLIVAFFLIFICWNTFRVFRQVGRQSSQHDATLSL